MLRRFVQNSFFGRSVYHLSSHKYFKYTEEEQGYIIPEKYFKPEDQLNNSEKNDKENKDDYISGSTILQEKEYIVIDWDSDDDLENPYNWPTGAKVVFSVFIGLLTVSVYMGSAIYTPGIDQLMKEFNINQTVATLPMTLFVFGYGMGPMVFSPLSENAVIGRTSIYIITLFIFFILQIPTALAKNITSLCILRFLGGIFASPILATGGASYMDVLNLPYMPVGLGSWGLAAWLGPTLGPFFGSILCVKAGWRWSFWFLAIVSGICFLVLFIFLPESYGKTILYRKAQRLRALTGNSYITSEGEIENSRLTKKELLLDILWRPIEIILTEPVVLLIDIYIAMTYSVMYLWFEAFPIVFQEYRGWGIIEMGVAYLSIIVGVLIGAAVYILILDYKFTKPLLRKDEVFPEVFLPCAILGAVLLPIGVFIFGWTSTKDAHWIGSLIGAAFFGAAGFMNFQTLFNYMGMSFPRYIASAYAGNDLMRALIAGSFPLFGRYLFNNLSTKKYPVAWGSSLLGFITIGMILIPVLFYLNGPKLRARSKYSAN